MDNIKVILSKRFSLIKSDYVRGLGMACLTAALVVIQNFIEKGTMHFAWGQVGMAAIGGGVGYLIKNGLFEPSKVITTVSTKSDIEPEVVASGIKNILP